MSANEWADLARLAGGATPGPWEARRDDLTDEMRVVHDTEHVSHVADVGVYGMPRVEEDAEFIAAANPATILRLIAENRDLSERLALAYRDEGLAHDERDALAARLAAVKALHRPAYFEDTPEVAYCAHCQASGDPFAPAGRTWPCTTAAALSAAPTDTTKEN